METSIAIDLLAINRPAGPRLCSVFPVRCTMCIVSFRRRGKDQCSREVLHSRDAAAAT